MLAVRVIGLLRITGDRINLVALPPVVWAIAAVTPAVRLC
jgi:hypothetical protein